MKHSAHLMWKHILSLVIVASLAAVHLFSLELYPSPHCDEPNYSAFGYDIIQHHSFGAPPVGPVYNMDKNFVSLGRVYGLGLGTVLSILGISLFSARLYSLFGYVVMIAVVTLTAGQILGKRTALWAAGLAALSWKTFYAAHLTRPEIWLAAVTLLPLWFILGAEATPQRRNPFLGYSLAGLIASLAIDIHFNGAFFLVGMSLAVVYLTVWRKRQPQLLLAFGLGIVIGLIWWTLRFLPDPALAWEQWRTGYTRQGLGIGTTTISSSLAMMVNWLVESFTLANRGLDLVETILYLVGIGLALRRRNSTDIVLLCILGGSLVSFAVLMPQKLVSYRVLWIPLLSIFAVAGISQLVELLSHRWQWLADHPQWGMPALLVPMFVLLFSGWLWLSWLYLGGDYAATAAKLRALVPPNTHVIGDPIWWFSFRADHTYINDFYLQLYATEVTPPLEVATPIFQPQLTPAQLVTALRKIKTQFVILDEALHCRANSTYPLFSTLVAWVEQNCQLIGAVPGGWVSQNKFTATPLGQTSRVYSCALALK